MVKAVVGKFAAEGSVELVKGFAGFLPAGWVVEVGDEDGERVVWVTKPGGEKGVWGRMGSGEGS